MLTTGEKIKIIQEVERNPAVSQNETGKCSELPLSTLSNTIAWKASILGEESL
jgi:hypothetical protein